MEFSSVELWLWKRKALGASFADLMSISASLLKDQTESCEGVYYFTFLSDRVESGWILLSSSKSPLQFVGLMHLDQNGFHSSSSFQLYMALISYSTLWCHWVLHGLNNEHKRKPRRGSWSHVWGGCPRVMVQGLFCGIRSLHALMWTGEVDCSFMLGQWTQKHHAHLHHQPRLSQSGDSNEVRRRD